MARISIRDRFTQIRLLPFLTVLLATIFVAELAIMFGLQIAFPTHTGGPIESFADAILLVLVLTPILWWMLVHPLQSSVASEQQRTARLVAILEATPDLVGITDLDGRVAYLNHAGRKMLGMDELVDLTKHNLREFYDAANARVVVTEGIPTAIRDGAWSGETELVALDGHTIATSQVILAHKAPDGTLAFVSIIARDITERRRAREALEESQENYTALFANMVQGLAYCQMRFEGNQPQDFVYLAVNTAFESLTGLQNVVGRRVTEIFPGIREADPELFEIYGRVARTGHPERFEHYFKPLDAWLDISVYSPREGYFVAVFDNITERKRADERLERNEAELREAQRIAGIGSWEWMPATDTVIWSEGLNRILARDFDLPVPAFETLARFYTPESWERLGAAVAGALETGAPYDLDLEMVRDDGTTLWTTTRGETSRGPDGTVVMLRGTVHDIDKRHQADVKLRLQSAALNAAADAMFITDRDGTIEWINAAFTDLHGYNEEEALGKNPRELVKSDVHDQESYKDLWDTILAGRVWHGELTNRGKDGSLCPVAVTITPVKDARGEPTHFIAINRDLTEERRLEAQFRQAQKMESVGQLAGGIAHDFNNLLTVINGMSGLILEQVGPDNPVHADAKEIHAAGERAATLTRQLLAFSRQQILAPQVMTLGAVVAGMEGLLRRLLGEDINLTIVPAPDEGGVKADPGQIEQVIANLAVNARDAMPQGGRLTIETQNVTIDEHNPRQHGPAVLPGGPYVSLVVSDSGIGMDEATRARVFEPFFTTKGPGKGTGLGLATVYGIVKQSHGFIWVYSEVGQGTRVEVCLPQVTEAPAGVHPKPPVAPPSGTETILLVEDSAALRKIVTRFLEPAGYTVLEAATAEEALGRLARQKAPVHLLLSDVVMPDMSGRQLAERLAQTHPGMKGLYMSGYTSDTILRHGVLEARMPFLGKPFTAAALLHKIREVLDWQA